MHASTLTHGHTHTRIGRHTQKNTHRCIPAHKHTHTNISPSFTCMHTLTFIHTIKDSQRWYTQGSICRHTYSPFYPSTALRTQVDPSYVINISVWHDIHPSFSLFVTSALIVINFCPITHTIHHHPPIPLPLILSFLPLPPLLQYLNLSHWLCADPAKKGIKLFLY